MGTPPERGSSAGLGPQVRIKMIKRTPRRALSQHAGRVAWARSKLLSLWGLFVPTIPSSLSWWKHPKRSDHSKKEVCALSFWQITVQNSQYDILWLKGSFSVGKIPLLQWHWINESLSEHKLNGGDGSRFYTTSFFRKFQVFTGYTHHYYGSKVDAGSQVLALLALTSQHLHHHPQAQGMTSAGSVSADGLWSLSRAWKALVFALTEENP